eukprot:Sdes_comp20499_c0_seq1m14956
MKKNRFLVSQVPEGEEITSQQPHSIDLKEDKSGKKVNFLSINVTQEINSTESAGPFSPTSLKGSSVKLKGALKPSSLLAPLDVSSLKAIMQTEEESPHAFTTSEGSTSRFQVRDLPSTQDDSSLAASAKPEPSSSAAQNPATLVGSRFTVSDIHIEPSLPSPSISAASSSILAASAFSSVPLQPSAPTPPPLFPSVVLSSGAFLSEPGDAAFRPVLSQAESDGKSTPSEPHNSSFPGLVSTSATPLSQTAETTSAASSVEKSRFQISDLEESMPALLFKKKKYRVRYTRGRFTVGDYWVSETVESEQNSGQATPCEASAEQSPHQSPLSKPSAISSTSRVPDLTLESGSRGSSPNDAAVLHANPPSEKARREETEVVQLTSASPKTFLELEDHQLTHPSNPPNHPLQHSPSKSSTVAANISRRLSPTAFGHPPQLLSIVNPVPLRRIPSVPSKQTAPAPGNPQTSRSWKSTTQLGGSNPTLSSSLAPSSTPLGFSTHSTAPSSSSVAINSAPATNQSLTQTPNLAPASGPPAKDSANLSHGMHANIALLVQQGIQQQRMLNRLLGLQSAKIQNEASLGATSGVSQPASTECLSNQPAQDTLPLQRLNSSTPSDPFLVMLEDLKRSYLALKAENDFLRQENSTLRRQTLVESAHSHPPGSSTPMMRYSSAEQLADAKMPQSM